MLAGKVEVPLVKSDDRVTEKQRPEDARESVNENEHLSLQFLGSWDLLYRKPRFRLPEVCHRPNQVP